MKKAFIRPAIAALLLISGASLLSCKDYLNVTPTAYSTSEETFSTVDGATTAVIGAYDMLSGDTGYGNRLSSYFPFDSDEMVGSIGASDAGRRGIARYSAIPSNSEVNNPWVNLYQGIERANICLKFIPQSSKYTGGSSAEQASMKRLYGEMLALRAQYYFELVRNWGDVPEPRTASVTGQDFNLYRTDRDSIYAHLVKDLAVAENLVPWRSDNGAISNERFSKGAIKGLRARIALFRGGWSMGVDGQERRAADYLDYYRIARTECLDLMNNRTQHTLNAKFDAPFRSIANIDGAAANAADNAHEVIFAIGAGGASAQSDSKLGYYNGPRLTGSPTFGQSSGAITIVPTYFYAFDSTDTRRDVTVTPYVIDATDTQKGATLLSTTDGKYRRDWRSPALSSTTLQSLSFDWIVLRFSDVLLMYAEAENELNGPSSSAVAALMEVRRRGYGTATAPAVSTASKAAFFDELTKERFVEFGGEGIRKYDLIRWNLLTAKIAQTRLDVTAMADQTTASRYSYVPLKMYFTSVTGSTSGLRWARSFYKPAPATAPTGTTAVNWRSSITTAFVTTNWAAGYTPLKQVLPIPQTARDNNPNLTQNAGY
ncbi:RagB/SusD family nutrient uptake outer membrane protein [Hymenobacter rubidus]|uniref:RagB/SusD family nutrient uptake outer membrane protein n=1 Tax=Hymenobacter rubidus TaxID=1441626 RepID=UPI00191FB395|nr:RagB/SusD family nutrient uptake outer membrane protein [Hymenobacter rubidus]